jgi:hypothetical protein
MASVDNLLPFIKPGWVGVEIGVQWGISSLALLEKGVRFLFLVDPWITYEGYGIVGANEAAAEEHNLRICRGRLHPYDDGRHFAILRMPSAEAPRFLPNDLDFVWIDGNHDYAYIKKDIDLYWPKIRPGGLLCGHDYGDDPGFGVNHAVDEFAKGKDLLKLRDMCWAVWK